MPSKRSPLNVVITGASSGIGQATAEAFARKGARLVLAARGQQALEHVAARCRELGAEALVVPTEVGDYASVQALALQARQFLSSIDLWLSNVGVGAVGRFDEVPMAAHEQVLRANLLGHIHDAHAVIPIFRAQGFGTFVNMISIGGFVGTPYAAAYSASKFGLRGFSEALRGELSDAPDIHVCDVYPTFVDTPAIPLAGNYTGKRLSAPPPLLDARRVAAAIVDLARSPRNSVVLGTPAPLIRFAHWLAPAASLRLGFWLMRRYFRNAEEAEVTPGRVATPPQSPTGIDGGLRRGVPERGEK